VSAILELSGVTRVHGAGRAQVRALSDVTLSVGAGEFIAVMGPSGSGKSTLLTIAGGLDVPTAGSVLVEGADIAAASAAERSAMRRRSIGYVFQDLNLISALTAAENVALPLELDGWRARRAQRAALDALRTMDIGDLADRFPDEMSGGQQQRVAIARAMVGERRLLLADEPTGALDSATGEAVIAVLRQRCDDGLACVMVTHEARLAAWADRTVFLRDGILVDDSGPRTRVEDLVHTRGAG
jgi:putative ABC transport system ATP-binding protein